MTNHERQTSDDLAPGQIAQDSEEVDTESRPWRGVFVVDPEREILFTHEVELKTVSLPEWEPEVVLSHRSFSDET